MSTVFQINDTNNICSYSLLWSQSTIDNFQPILYVCFIASIVHAIFWLQPVFYSFVRQKTMQWMYAYLVTDLLLIIRFFFLYIVRTRSTDCMPNQSWYIFICYFEATLDNYLNILEVYILLALNICRYLQIAHSKNVYITNVRLLIVAHLSIYVMPLINLIIQTSVHWTNLNMSSHEICDLKYTNIYIQIFNIIVAFALPISLNILVIYASARYVQLSSQLRQTRHHVSAREKYNHSLVLQFLIFYSVWIILWSPNIIAFQLQNPIIIGALDARFRRVWREIYNFLKTKWYMALNRHRRRIVPNTISARLRVPHHVRVTPL
ncbi:unnamed protein product [Adineta steineri]|uniref:G-protein coupled receptors family 1 profile domain-containing protein n=1 Tax=Adineta steineri TaxID=433720 RepID=A0A813XGD6_9BILA|nr:unnamed protein product [Adineta steineri]